MFLDPPKVVKFIFWVAGGIFQDHGGRFSGFPLRAKISIFMSKNLHSNVVLQSSGKLRYHDGLVETKNVKPK